MERLVGNFPELSQQEKTILLATKFSAQTDALINEGEKVSTNHRVLVIGEVEPYCPGEGEDEETPVGWCLFSTGPVAISVDSRIIQFNEELPLMEIVKFEELNGVEPKPGDFVHAIRDPYDYGKRVSIEIISEKSV